VIRSLKTVGWILWWACAVVLVVGGFKVYQALRPEPGGHDSRADRGSDSGVSLEEALDDWGLKVPEPAEDVHFSMMRHPLGQGDLFGMVFTSPCGSGAEFAKKAVPDRELVSPFNPTGVKSFALSHGWIEGEHPTSGAESSGVSRNTREVLIEDLSGNSCRFYLNLFG
jgi:hypothetical protein